MNTTENDYTLINAAEEGDLELVKIFLSRGADVNTQKSRNCDALKTAAIKGHTEVVKVLIDAGADVNAREENGETALMWAAQAGHAEVVKVLIDNGADVNAEHVEDPFLFDLDYRTTALLSAAWAGHAEVVRVLVENGADINANDEEGSTALMLAVAKDHAEVVRVLLDSRGADSHATEELEQALMTAVAKGHAEVVKVLLDSRGTDSHSIEELEQALMFASQEGHHEVVKVLLAEGVDVNAREESGLTALMFASRGGHPGVAKVLIDNGADVNTRANGHVTALIIASYNGHPEVVEMLLEAGADVNAQSEDGWTAFMIAASNGPIELAKCLLEAGAEINTPSNDGPTLLSIAASWGHLEVVKLLVEQGADVTEKNTDHLIALAIAALDSSLLDVVKSPFDARADVNTKSSNDRTALVSNEKIIRAAPNIIMRKDFFPRRNIEDAFGIKIRPELVPEIPFSEEDLLRARELNQFLILRIDRTSDGVPLTIVNMNKLLNGKLKDVRRPMYYDDGTGNIHSYAWFKNEDFATKETPRMGWALSSNGCIPNSRCKNYLEQTQEIVNYLKNQVFLDRTIPVAFQYAISQFEEVKDELGKLLKYDYRLAARKLANLPINKMSRQTPVEALYDIYVYFQCMGERLLKDHNDSTWTSGIASGNRLVKIHGLGESGIELICFGPDGAVGNLGTTFSRVL